MTLFLNKLFKFEKDDFALKTLFSFFNAKEASFSIDKRMSYEIFTPLRMANIFFPIFEKFICVGIFSLLTDLKTKKNKRHINKKSRTWNMKLNVKELCNI